MSRYYSIKDLKQCTFIRRDGSQCPSNTYRDKCAAHITCKEYKPCLRCGKPTRSQTQYCTCSHRQAYGSLKIARLQRKLMATNTTDDTADVIENDIEE